MLRGFPSELSPSELSLCALIVKALKRHHRPDRLDDSERPCPSEEAVAARERAADPKASTKRRPRLSNAYMSIMNVTAHAPKTVSIDGLAQTLGAVAADVICRPGVDPSAALRRDGRSYCRCWMAPADRDRHDRAGRAPLDLPACPRKDRWRPRLARPEDEQVHVKLLGRGQDRRDGVTVHQHDPSGCPV